MVSKSASASKQNCQTQTTAPELVDEWVSKIGREPKWQARRPRILGLGGEELWMIWWADGQDPVDGWL